MQTIVVAMTKTMARKVGIAFAALHLAIFLVFIVYLKQSTEGQAVLLWTLWRPVDFPVSLLVPLGFEFFTPDEGVGSVMRRALPYLVHGVLGSIWWYAIPSILTTVFKKLCSLAR